MSETTGTTFLLARGSVLTVGHLIDPATYRPGDVRHRIDTLSDLRHDLLLFDSATSLSLDYPKPNFTGAMAILEAVHLLAGAARVNVWLQPSSAGTVPARTALSPPIDEPPFSPRWYPPNGAVEIATQAHEAMHVLLRFQEEALPPDNTVALLRLLDGILAALGLMLIRVLAALGRQPDALTFVLVMLATCLRYGRREEQDGDTFLPIRRFQTSLGSCPHG